MIVEIGTLGAYLHQQMYVRKATCRDVATACGLSPATICRMANGKGYSLASIIPVADWLELTPTELWEFLKQEEKP